MNAEQTRWSLRYRVALKKFLHAGAQAKLLPAARLGRQAAALSLETLELALVHEQAVLGRVLPVAATTARKRIILRANQFFAEAITPLEEGHRWALEANIHLNRMNKALSQRTLDLAASNWELKKEIARHHVVEETLRQSEQQSSRLLEQSRLLQDQLRLLSREIEVLQLIAEGAANKQIAATLAISAKTVEKHRAHLMQKLDIHDTAGLTRFAISTGIIESSVQLTIV